MDNILLCSNHIPLVTSIHNTFIEKYMLGANGSYVKVYLYLSKCIQAGQEDLSISSLADQMENTEKDILRALNYWEKKGLLEIMRDEDQTIIGIDILNPDELPVEKTTAKKAKPVGAKKETAARIEAEPQVIARSSGSLLLEGDSNLQTSAGVFDSLLVADVSATSTLTEASPAESSKDSQHTEKHPAETTHSFQVSTQTAKRLSKNQDFAWTCNVVESFLNRLIKPGELQMLSYLYDELSFSSELIVYLYEYCTSIDKTSVHYVQSVALGWHKAGITTPEEAAEHTAAYHADYRAIAKACALDRPLAAIERKYIDHWQKDWHMSTEIICEACDRTMLKLQHADFKYTEGILEKWFHGNIHTIQEIQKADQKHAQQNNPQKPAAPSRSKNSQLHMIEHGLTKDEADALEQKLLRKA